MKRWRLENTTFSVSQTCHTKEGEQYHYCFPKTFAQQNIDKYTPLIIVITNKSWQSSHLLSTQQQGWTHTSTLKTLTDRFTLPPKHIKTMQTQLGTTTIRSLFAIILNKDKLETKICTP